MDKDKIALDFITVYKKYKDRSSRSGKSGEGEKLLKRSHGRKRRQGRIYPDKRES